MFNKVLLIGDEFGLPLLLDVIPHQVIAGVLVASNRPQNHILIQKMIKRVNIPFFIQPPYLSQEYRAFYNELKNTQADCLFCNSYSMLIREDILRLVNFHAFNVHASYLPFNRGPNPIQWAIINGHEYTGVTIHRMDFSFDSGDIINQRKIAIPFDCTWVSLKEVVSATIEKLCYFAIPEILKGKFTSHKQDECISNTNPRLTADYPKIDFYTMSDTEIYNLIRAQVNPLKGAYAVIDGQRYYFDEFVPFDLISQLRNNYCR